MGEDLSFRKQVQVSSVKKTEDLETEEARKEPETGRP
jgi:hypothetical protein